MENNNNIKPVDGSMEVLKSEAGKILKEHGNKVMNNNVDAFVTLKDINKIYPNGVQAVYDFNIDIAENDFIVLVGPSGCGKSTTLRMIAGLEDITSGYLYIDKVLSNYAPSKDRDISMVFQSYALYPQMTVYDNIAFPLKARKYRRVLESRKLMGWDQALKVLENPKDLVEAMNEAKNKNLNFGTNVEYVATKLHICDEAAKILVKYQINHVIDLEKLNKKGQRLIEEIYETAEIERTKEKARIANKGYTMDDEYHLLKNDELQYGYRKMSKEEIRKKVFEAAEILDLGPYLDRRPKELSGGQMQRVALGRAIVRNAKLFLMDEPLSNLDAKLRVQMRSEIVRIHEAIGATTIYVTHDQTEAMTMATKIAVMSKGWVQQIGTPQEIYYNPKNIFVATFIGAPAMNIFEGEYENGIVTFKSGYQVKLHDSFVEKHDNYYRNKIADLERMLELSDFKKIHALKIIDESAFALDHQIDISNIEKLITEVLELSHDVDCTSELQSLLGKYNGETIVSLIEEINSAHEINAKNKLEEIAEVVDKITDEHGKTAQMLIDSQRERLSLVDVNNYSLPIYMQYISDIKAAIEAVKAVGNKGNLIMSKLNQLNVQNQLAKSDKGWLLEIRRPLLTFEKISSSDIGKLHNAQVFNKNEKQQDSTLYYQKPRNKKKKSNIKVNLNSVDVEFINNLYDVAVNLLDNCRKALAGKHGVRIGIRPEDIHLNHEFDGDKTQGFNVTSDVVELLGSELLIHTNWSKTNMIAKISTGTLIKPHTEVQLTLNRDKILIFDENCGDTI